VGSLSVFIAILVITAITGTDPYRSFFSTQERMTGVFVLVHFYVWFLILISVFRTYKEWKKLIFCTVGVAVFVSVFGYVNQDSDIRAISTVGNALFFGSYILLHIFLLFFLVHSEKYKRRYYIFFFFILLLYISSLFLSGSRMIVVSLFFGVFLFAVSYFQLRSFKKVKKIYFGCLCSVVLFVGCILYINIVQIGNVWAKKKLPYPIQRVFLFENYEKLRGARIEAWRMGLEGFKERPLLGWGMENYPYIFQKYYRAPIVDEGESYADRSHNQYVDILALTGIVGLISYLVFFAVLFIFLIRTSIREKEAAKKIAGMGLVVLFLTYLFQNSTSFDSPALLIVLYFSFALSYFFISEHTNKEKTGDSKNIVWKFPFTVGLFGAAVALCVIFIAQRWSINPFIKNMQARVAFNTAKERGLNEETMSYFKRSLNSDSFTNYETRSVLAKSVYNLYTEKRAISKDFAKQQIVYAIAELDKSIVSRPLDVKNYFSQILLYRIMTPYSQDTFEKIEQRIQMAYTLASYRPEIYREFPETYIATKDFVKAEEWVRKGADHFIPSQETHWQLAVIFLQKGDIEGGLLELTEAEKNGYPILENPNMAILLSQKLLDGKKNPSALHYIDRMVHMYPDNKDVLNAQSEAHKKAE